MIKRSVCPGSAGLSPGNSQRSDVLAYLLYNMAPRSPNAPSQPLCSWQSGCGRQEVLSLGAYVAHLTLSRFVSIGLHSIALIQGTIHCSAGVILPPWENWTRASFQAYRRCLKLVKYENVYTFVFAIFFFKAEPHLHLNLLIINFIVFWHSTNSRRSASAIPGYLILYIIILVSNCILQAIYMHTELLSCVVL